MYNLDLERFKLILSLKYKKYLKNNDKKLFLDLMKEFLIPIDVLRIDDFVITSFDPSRVAISVIDKKTNTVYYSSYKTNERNFVFGCNLEVQIVNNSEKITKVYNGRNRKPISEELNVIYGNHELKINKDFCKKVNSFTYSEILDSFDHKSFPIFTESFSSSNCSSCLIDNRNLCIHSNCKNPYRKGEFLDEDVSIVKNNIIYRINDSSVFGNNVRGICFLDGDISSSLKEKVMPLAFSSNYFASSFENGAQSVLLFDADDDKDSVNLRIIKSKNGIDVYYEKTYLSTGEFLNEHFDFPILSYGKITSSEIKLLSKVLKEKCDNVLVDSICNRLENFGSIIDSEKEKKEIDLIDKDFYNYSIEEMGNVISCDKESYFKYMSDLYHRSIDEVRLPKEDGKVLSKKVK